MKNILTIALLGILSLQQLAFSQTNAETGSTNQAVIIEVATNPPPATAASNETETVAVVTNTMATTNVVAVTTTTTETTVSNETTVATDDVPVTPPPAPAAPVIPLIQFQEVPITTAIENLARQAGINYLLDPKIGYGQPDQNGQIKPEPTLSIRWENITAEHALVALLNNYNLQLVEDPKIKISRITIKDPAAPPPLVTRVIQLKYASVSNMEAAVTSALTDKRSRVIPDARTSQLVVVATEREQTELDTLVSQLDRPTRQVLIETRLVEISSNPATKKGIDWSGTLQGQNIKFGNNALPGVPSSSTPILDPGGSGTVIGNSVDQGIIGGILNGPGLLANTANGFNPGTFFLNADGVSAVLSFLNQSSDAQVVSTPRVVTLDNETATISVTRAFPIFSTTAGTQGSPGGSSVTYSNLGTILEVTPRISANDYIWLKVVPEVSSFFGDKTSADGLQSAPQFDSRKISTQVLVPNANTLVMGGMVKDNPQATYTKVPLLGDIPGLGYAFRSEAKSLDKNNLLIFITPTIVKDTDFEPTETEFLQSRPTTMKSPMNPNTAWDSAMPKGDWSNPVPTPGEFDKSRSQ